MRLTLNCAMTGENSLYIDTNTKVTEIIESLRKLFGMAKNGYYEISWSGLPAGEYYLDRSKTLSDYAVKENDALILHDLGTAV